MTQPIPPQVTGSDEAAAWYGNRTVVWEETSPGSETYALSYGDPNRALGLVVVPVDEYERLAAVATAARAAVAGEAGLRSHLAYVHALAVAVDALDAP